MMWHVPKSMPNSYTKTNDVNYDDDDDHDAATLVCARKKKQKIFRNSHFALKDRARIDSSDQLVKRGPSKRTVRIIYSVRKSRIPRRLIVLIIVFFWLFLHLTFDLCVLFLVFLSHFTLSFGFLVGFRFV